MIPTARMVSDAKLYAVFGERVLVLVANDQDALRVGAMVRECPTIEVRVVGARFCGRTWDRVLVDRFAWESRYDETCAALIEARRCLRARSK